MDAGMRRRAEEGALAAKLRVRNFGVEADRPRSCRLIKERKTSSTSFGLDLEQHTEGMGV